MQKWSRQEVVLFLTLEVALFLALERLKSGTKNNSPACVYIYRERDRVCAYIYIYISLSLSLLCRRSLLLSCRLALQTHRGIRGANIFVFLNTPPFFVHSLPDTRIAFAQHHFLCIFRESEDRELERPLLPQLKGPFRRYFLGASILNLYGELSLWLHESCLMLSGAQLATTMVTETTAITELPDTDNHAMPVVAWHQSLPESSCSYM